ncbi:MAG TPA: hypothetical protein VHD84_00125 [Candidatus Saccharimonadales bacterium]|nr:hypothetical protein [Candidatus Saccharimonadales bacterium]
MAVLAVKPSLNDLYTFIDRVEDYPISAGRVAELAHRAEGPKSVADFYRSFDPDTIFTNKEDLTTRSEQVDIIRHEEMEMPAELDSIPEED